MTSAGSVRDVLRSKSAGRTPVRGANAAPVGSVRDALRSGPKARTCYVYGKEGHFDYLEKRGYYIGMGRWIPVISCVDSQAGERSVDSLENSR
jgi:hypothetical protein